MIKATSLQTDLIDDIQLACQDLEQQFLDSKLTLLKNSVGIIQCDPEFLELGLLDLLYKKLKIPFVGGTTISVATNNAVGNFLFSMLILTSDQIEFVVNHTTGLFDDHEKAIEQSIKPEMEKMEKMETENTKKPLNLVMLFPTVTDNDNFPGDFYVETTERICGNVPIFGTLSVNEGIDKFDRFDRSMSICNDKAFNKELTYLLFFGDITPRFFIATSPMGTNFTEDNVIVTKSQDHIVKEINNVLAVEYFEKIGIATNGVLVDGAYFVPFLITTSKFTGKPVRQFVRAIMYFNDEGHAIFRGKIPEGSSLAFASLNAVDIVQATSEILTQMSQEPDVHAAIIFSCIIRQLSVGPNPFRELEKVQGLLKDTPFIASYSGGEIAPVNYKNRAVSLNTFHNYSLIACLL
ncbi:MAG: FIST C-terminal domain-containing protein [Defluviitaleaceae bacterium]|nr:FIST C-terminal domain-containing protein [Defluviitaleaceae bacterium]